MEQKQPAGIGPVERGVRPHAIRLASQLQSAAYSHGYEDGHPSNATTRQDKYSAASQRLRVALCEEIDRLYAAEAKTNSYIVDNARLAEDAERYRWLRDNTHPDNLRKLFSECPVAPDLGPNV